MNQIAFSKWQEKEKMRERERVCVCVCTFIRYVLSSMNQISFSKWQEKRENERERERVCVCVCFYIYSTCSLFYESNFFEVLGEAQGRTGFYWNKGLHKAKWRVGAIRVKAVAKGFYCTFFLSFFLFCDTRRVHITHQVGHHREKGEILKGVSSDGVHATQPDMVKLLV